MKFSKTLKQQLEYQNLLQKHLGLECKAKQQTNKQTNKTSIFPVAHAHCILANKFMHSFFFSIMCVLKNHLSRKGKKKYQKKKPATKLFFDLNILKTSVMLMW